MIALLLIGDGRDDVHERSWTSVRENLPRLDTEIVVDDSDHRLGFAGAIQEGWRQVLGKCADYVVHVELDFLFNAPVPVDDIIATLDARPYLAQVCLKRQPVNEQEKAAGGIVERDPDAYVQRTAHGRIWTENRVCFSTNPCIYPAALCCHGWPQESESEGKFSAMLREDPDCRFAFWGPKFAEPMVEHIGERVGRGY